MLDDTDGKESGTASYGLLYSHYHGPYLHVCKTKVIYKAEFSDSRVII